MATWTGLPTNESNINGGNEYAGGDSLTIEQINSVVNNGIYAKNTVNGMGIGGAYSSAVTYKYPNIVSYNGGSYMAIYAVSSVYTACSNKVPTNATYWKFLTNGIVSNVKTSTTDNVDIYTITYTNGTTSVYSVTNGKSIFYRYATSVSGANMSATWDISKTYLGVYVGLTASATASDYSWSLFKGDSGNPTGNILQVLGTSTTDTMSQNAITAQLKAIDIIKQPNITTLLWNGTSATSNILRVYGDESATISLLINWGDGTSQSVVVPIVANDLIPYEITKTANYANDGYYVISISVVAGTFKGFYFGDGGDKAKVIEAYLGANCPCNDSSFKGCSNLRKVEFANGWAYTDIGNQAFYGCGSLQSMTIPSGVTTIGTSVFLLCTSLTTVAIPDSVTTIYGDCFRNCTHLNYVRLPSTITTLPTNVFYNCTNLETITIPAFVTSIKGSAFYGCTGLKHIHFAGTKADWDATSIEEFAFTSVSALVTQAGGNFATVFVTRGGTKLTIQ